MSRVVVIGALPESLLNFRGDLLKALVASGHEVTAMAAEAGPAVTLPLARIGIRFKPFPVQRNSLNPLNDIKTYLSLLKAFKELKPDIVLSYTIKPVVWGGMALKRMSCPRFYALVTGQGFALQDGGIVRKMLTLLVTRLYRAPLSKASGVIFQNPDDQHVFVSRRIVDQDKCALVDGSGVDLGRFAVAPLPANGVVFLAVGRLLGEKGFREYAQAAGLVKMRYPEAVFRLVGPEDSSPDGIPLAEVRAWEARGLVDYLGATDDVRPFIADCHVFVLPSYHEGMPRTVLEAMAMGRPILTTDVPGCRETVISGDNGNLVPKADAIALADMMIWFIEKREEWQRMGERSRKIAETRFDVHKINRQLMEIMKLYIPESNRVQKQQQGLT